MNPKIFSVEEANALLPQLNSILIRLQDKKKQIELKQVEIDLMEIVNTSGAPSGTSISKIANKSLDELNTMVQEYTQLFEEVETWGPVIKDVTQGLVDFYHVRDQQLIFLCWKQGEPRISFWHDLENGFPGRQKL